MNLSRRALIAGLAAAAALATPASAVVAPAAPENPALLALGDTLAECVAEFDAAVELRRATFREWAPQWPKAPESIVRQHHDQHALERDIDGYAASPARSIWSSHDLAIAAYELEKAISRKRKNPLAPFSARWLDKWFMADRPDHEAALADLMRRLDDAVAYNAARERVLSASNWGAVKDRETAAANALAAAVAAVLTEPADTLAGIIIKAEALDAYARLPPYNRAMVALNGKFAGIGSELLRIASAHA